MGVNLCLGVLYSWSVFKKALTEQLGWSHTDASWPYTVAIIMFALIMVPAGRLTDKWGPRIVATLGGIFAGVGMILASLTQSLSMLIVAFGILLGTGMGLGYAAPTPAAVKWFGPHKRGLISGLVVAGFGLASVYIAPLTNYLLKFGIQRAFLVEGIIFLVAIVLLSQFVIFPPKGYQPAQPPAPPQEEQKPRPAVVKHEYDWPEMLKTPAFYLIWFTYVLGASAGLMIIGHLASIAKTQAGVAYGFILVALLAVLNAGGRVISGWLGDFIGRTNTLLLVLLIQALNMFFFMNYTTMLTLTIGALIAGYCYGSLLSLFPSITYEYYGTKHAGVNYGFVFTAWGVGGVVGPIIAGKVVDLTGVYNQAYLIAAGLCLIGALLTRFTRPPKAPEISSSVGA
ncbi:MAG: OFA family MFS transporter [Bacillota bacterium]|nr:OFA family MFS transporter [Bacillota bacterium]